MDGTEKIMYIILLQYPDVLHGVNSESYVLLFGDVANN